MSLTEDELIALVLASFEAERTGDVTGGLALLHPEFEVVDVWIGSDETLFPRVTAAHIASSIGEVYQIKERRYEFPTIVADASQQTVILEFVESYPDPRTGQLYVTPQVAICQIKDGKLWRTRHYTDPRLSYLTISPWHLDNLFQ